MRTVAQKPQGEAESVLIKIESKGDKFVKTFDKEVRNPGKNCV